MVNITANNGNTKRLLAKGVLGGGIGVSTVIGIYMCLSPLITGNTEKIHTLETKHEKLCTEFAPIKVLPQEVKKLQDDVKDLRTLFILVNKDNPDLKRYLELSK